MRLPCFGPIGPEYNASNVQSLLFIAAHLPVSAVDVVILANGVRELAQIGPLYGPARMWVLLNAAALTPEALMEAQVLSRRLRTGVCVWSQDLLWEAFPQVQGFLNTSTGYARKLVENGACQHRHVAPPDMPGGVRLVDTTNAHPRKLGRPGRRGGWGLLEGSRPRTCVC